MPRVAYAWNEHTKEYAGPKIAYNTDKDGNFLLPGKSTWDKPPEPGDHEAVVWSGQTWELVPDYRGKEFYHTETRKRKKIESIGEAPSPDMTEKKPLQFTTWDGKDWTLDETKWMEKAIKPDRDKRLRDTDWTQLPDAPLTAEQVQAYRVYRQKLRDLPDTITFTDPEFPQEPKI